MLIAHRNGMMVSSGWQNPYITDGLVAMWDGEWNAGWGVHDAAATTWKDLVGTRDATMSGQYSWGTNYWDVQSVSGRGLAQWNGTNLPNDQTWEIVIYPSATSGYGRIIAEGPGVASPIIYNSTDKVYMYGYNKDTGQTVLGLNNRELHLHSIVHPAGGPMIYYIDAADVWTVEASGNSIGATYGYFANRGSDYGRGLDAKYYSVRLYSRALTATEIAHNYAVDNERFNLTKGGGQRKCVVILIICTVCSDGSCSRSPLRFSRQHQSSSEWRAAA